MNETTLQHALAEAQRFTHAAVDELTEEARTLLARVEAEVRSVMGEAQESGRERFAQLGAELVRLGQRLVKLGHRLEKMAVARKTAAPRRKKAARRETPRPIEAPH